MANRILLVLNKVDRETVLMERIAAAIRRSDPAAKVEIMHRMANGFVKLAVQFRPTAILTFPMTGEGLSLPYLIIKNITNCRIICLRTEGIMNYAEKIDRDLHTGYDAYRYPLVDLELFWGPGMAEMVDPALVAAGKLASMEQTRIVGYNRLEPYFDATLAERDDSEPVLRVLKGLDRNTVVMAVTGFHFADYTETDIFNARDLDAANNLPVLLKEVEACARLRDVGAQLGATARAADTATHATGRMSTKPYDEAFAGLGNVFVVRQPIPAEYLISKAGLLLHYGSTCLVDAVLSRIPSVHVKSEHTEIYFRDFSRESSFLITPDEVPALISRHLASPLPFELTSGMRRDLMTDFAVDLDRPYHPSQTIAEILLDPTPAIPLSPEDPFVARAMDLFYSNADLTSASTYA